MYMKNLLNKKILAVALVFALIGTFTGIAISHQAVSAEEKTVLTSPFTEAIEKVHQSVVGINNYSIKQFNGGINGFGGFGGFGFGFDWGFPDRYFRDQQPESKEVLYGAGSGVVVDKGYVLTNYHVVDGASRLTVVVDDKEHESELVAFNEQKDLAVLKVKDLDLEPVKMGDSSQIQLGDWAIAIGNPVSLPGTTTVGVISAVNRKIPTSNTVDRFGRRSDNYSEMIQTDAAINSGNSGGGLFNTSGELIGVPTLKYSTSSYGQAQIDGIGFAIPINEAKNIIKDAVEGKGKKVYKNEAENNLVENPKPRMGVTISDINPNSRAVQEGIIPQGVSVRFVESNSPAEKAGIKENDIIVEADGSITKSTSELMNIVGEKKVGDTVKLKVYRIDNFDESAGLDAMRDGKYIDLEVSFEMLDGQKQ